MQDPTTMHLAAQMKTARKRLGWTAVELGQRMANAGVAWDRFTVANVESGKRQTVAVQEWLTLARVLDTDPADLVGLEPSSPQTAPLTVLYAHSDGETYSYIDRPGGIPDTARERAILRGLLTHVLSALERADMGLDLPQRVDEIARDWNTSPLPTKEPS